MKRQGKVIILLHIVLVLGLLAQTVQFVFAQDHGYLPPADPADRLVETWQEDGSGILFGAEENALPGWQLPEQAETLLDLVPEHLPVVQAETSAKDETGQGIEVATITADGAAAFFLNQQLLILVDQGAVAQDIELRLTSLEPNSVYGAANGPADQLRFQLTATDTKTDAVLTELAQTYYMALDLTGLSTPDAQWFVAFQDIDEAYAWIYPEPQLHNETGIFSVPYQAMGLVSAGNEALITLNEGGESEENLPKPWRYQWQVPAVSTFSGAATYQYPIEVPPGRGGLMPNIDISYSSGGINSYIYTDGLDQGPLGLGWNINQIEISRDKTEMDFVEPWNILRHADRFSLVIDGQSYRLVRYAGTTTTADYYAVNGPSLRIQQIYDTNAANEDDIYWVVKTGNGTTYRLGYTNDSESGQTVWPASLLSTDGNQLGGTRTDYGGLRWRVDTVTDVHGNQVQYDYEKWEEDYEEYQGPSGVTRVWTTRARMEEIRYNYVNTAAANTRATGSYATQIVFTLTAGDRRVDDIQFYHLNFAQPYRIVNVALSVRLYSNEPCGQGARSNQVQVVDSIREENVDSSYLPSVTFDYIMLHHDPARTNCFNFAHLDEVANGYGGLVNFTYEGDGRHNGYVIYNSPPVYVHPTYGQSFFVTQTETWDGVHSTPAVTEYDYETPCYDQESGDLGDLPGAWSCQTRPGMGGFTYGNGALVGFEEVTVTTRDYGVGSNPGVLLNETVSQFLQTQDRMGWVDWQEVYDADSTLIQKQENTYSSDSSTGFNFNFMSQQTTTQYVQGQTAAHTVKYEYARQNNVQYGNQTKVIEEGTIGGIPNRQRLVYREYYPNATAWIVGAVAREAVFEGTQGVTINTSTATPVADTRNFYDYQSNYQIAPLNKARLTRVDRLKTTAPLAYITVQQMVYDAVYTGNVEQVTDGNSHTTTTNYDTTYQLYPISVVNHLGHTQQFRYYYLNATYNDGPPGLLRELVDANGFTTYYFFDSFERLSKLFRGWNEQGADWSKPSEYYVYSDVNQTSVNPLRISTWKKTQDNAVEGSTGGTFERQFFDGLGRVIQTQRPHTDWTGNWGAPTGGQRVIADTGYNAAGQAIWQSQPYFKPAGVAYFTPDTSQARINTQYDARGQAVQQVGLDEAVTSTIYGLRSVYQQDGNSHIRASFFDPTGQLIRVDETIDAFRDAFTDNSSLSNWTKTGSGTFTVTGGHGRITNSTGTTAIKRTVSAVDESGTAFSFRVTNGVAHTQLFLARGTWNTAGYRLWGLQVQNGELRLQEWEGDSTATNETITPLMPVKNNTWYRVVLRSSNSAAYYNLVVWEQDNPAVAVEVRKDHPTWDYNDWVFDARTTGSNTLDIDTYDELDFHRTWYEYDVLGNLTEVTDAANNVTTMNYDALGRKVNMTDPDMGYWTYAYDNAGNLVTQTDPKQQIIIFAYDELNRLTSKLLADSGCTIFICNSTELLATYQYDNTSGGNKGVGRRTGMVAYDPPGVMNNSASWKYDSLGRVIQENRMFGSSTYRFDFGYTQGDLPVTVRYPGGTAGQQGEIVTTSYWWITGQPKTLVGDGTYVNNADYIMPTGQITSLKMATTQMETTYTYDVAFRLNSIKSRYVGWNRLWYTYTYDQAGNVSTITDQTPPGATGSQVQSFKYDSLNRLVQAQATGNGSGLYNETYAYDAVGNLINKAGQVMGYGTGTAGPHAVTTMNGVQQYWYDANGNMTQRPDGSSGTHTLYWTPENMLKQVINDKGVTQATFTYDADGMMVLRNQNGANTVYLGKLYQHNTATNVVTKHYMFNGQLVAQRTVDGQGGSSVTFLLGDHLGSVTTVLWASGAVKDNQRYNPWGEVRWAQSGNPITGYSYTSQRYDDALGLYDYNARYYDPALGRFISADTILPNASDGIIGLNSNSRLTPMTVAFNETVFLGSANEENRQLLLYGPSFTWDSNQKNEFNIPSGPVVPQTLNRYAYVFNNALSNTDPTGHVTFSVTLTEDQALALAQLFDGIAGLDQGNMADLMMWVGVVMGTIGSILTVLGAGIGSWLGALVATVGVSLLVVSLYAFQSAVAFLDIAEAIRDITKLGDGSITLSIDTDGFGVTYILEGNGSSWTSPWYDGIFYLTTLSILLEWMFTEQNYSNVTIDAGWLGNWIFPVVTSY